jgi:hypothetical protein
MGSSKKALTPLCALPGDYKTKTINYGEQAVGEDLVLQKPSANTREHRPRISWRMHRAPCYRFFIPSPFTTRWASRMVRHGLKAVPSTLFYMPNKPLTQ